MAPSVRSRTLKKNDLATFLKPLKPVLFSESLGRPSALIQKISCLSWSPTGALIATCTTANIRVWSSDRPTVKSSLELKNAHAKGGVAYGSPGISGDLIEKVAFSPTTENVLASSGYDGMVRLWDVRVPGGAATAAKGTALADCRVGDSPFLTWHPDGTQILCGRKDDVVHSIDVRRTTTGDGGAPRYEMAAERRMERGSTTYYGMAFSNGGGEIFATTSDGTVKILDYPGMNLLHTLGSHGGPCYTVAHSPSGTCVAVGGADGLVSLWDTYSWLSTHSLSAPSQTTSIRDLSFSFDGSYLVAGAGLNEHKDGGPGLNIYHVDTGEVTYTVETTNCPTYVAWHPTRYWVACAGEPGGFKIVGSGGSL